MASVEEICDHITLINKSHNILSGRVDEIRRTHGGNIFTAQFRGNNEALVGKLAGKCEILENEAGVTGFSTMKIHIADDGDVRPVIALINDNTELRSFSEIIPSMNDIFIRAVNGNL